MNIGKAVDKLQGNERRFRVRTDIHSHGDNCRKTDIIYPTKEPRQPKGLPNGGLGYCLKPALEPITVAKKTIRRKDSSRELFSGSRWNKHRWV